MIAEHKVRIGSPADHKAMMTFLCKMHEENGVANMDEKRVETVLMCGLARHNAIVGICDGKNGEIAGSAGLFVSEWWYSSDRQLEDRWLFVAPDYRREPIARPLLQFAKNTADGLGIPLLLGVLSDVRTEAKVRLYERQLGKSVGAIFLYGDRSRSDSQSKAA